MTTFTAAVRTVNAPPRPPQPDAVVVPALGRDVVLARLTERSTIFCREGEVPPAEVDDAPVLVADFTRCAIRCWMAVIRAAPSSSMTSASSPRVSGIAR